MIGNKICNRSNEEPFTRKAHIYHGKQARKEMDLILEYIWY